MKLILEFFDEEEMNNWIRRKASELGYFKEIEQIATTGKIEQTKVARIPYRETGINRRKEWTEWEMQVLVDNWGKKHISWFVSQLGVPRRAIYQKVHYLKVHGAELPNLRPRSIEKDNSQVL